MIPLAQSSCSGPPKTSEAAHAATNERPKAAATIFPGERHFRSLRQLTFGGQNAEAYFNGDGTELIFQSTRGEFECDQMFRMDVDGLNQRLVSTGVGRTTCGFIFPDEPKILYSSTHETLKTCPPRPDHSRGYVWPLLPQFEIYVAGAEGENPTPLAPHPGYDAEAVLSPKGDAIVFTSTRSGDVDIWMMKPDGTDLRQLTDEVGYDGGAFFSPDGQKIVYRAHHPTDPAALKDYKSLLDDDLVRPAIMNLMVMNRDGSEKRVILENGAANFAPYFHPDGERIIFASNMDSDAGRNFDLYLINIDGTGLERVTFNQTFDAFPMFSYDGRLLVFASNRDGEVDGETNVFVAEWTDDVGASVERQLEGPAAIDADEWHDIVKELASPELAGRGLGSDELTKAAHIIAAHFERVGLEPAGDGETFMQNFEAATSKTVKGAALRVGDRAAKLDEEFAPFAFSSTGEVESSAVLVGYGITSGRHEYDDYAGVEVEGKVAVTFRYEPRRHDADSKFDGTDPTRESDLRYKAINARHHGAAAMIVVNPPPAENGEEDDALYSFGGVPSEVGLPVLHLTWTAATRLFDESVLRETYEAIERTEAPASKELGEKVVLDVEIDATKTTVMNVVGRLPGDSFERAIVVGAHYDHLGLGGEGSLAAGDDSPHLGADDNASGVAAIIELAEAIRAVDRDTDIYFVAFTGEESGLLGSHWFVEHPPIPLTQIEAMLNFDMVGRLTDRRLHVLGTGTAKGLIDVVRRAQVGLPLDLATTPDGYGPSDQMAFYVRKVPVLHFFTGAHEDYHRPSDTADKVNPEGAALVVTFATRILHELANAPKARPYVAVRSASAGDSGGDGRRGYGPYFGSIPAFGGDSHVKGVRISGATAGSPAEAAGLQADDVIVKFGDYDVTTLKDYAFALRKHEVGDTVTVVVVRDGEELSLEATLSERKSTEGKSPGNPHGSSPHGESSQPHPERSSESGPSKSPH